MKLLITHFYDPKPTESDVGFNAWKKRQVYDRDVLDVWTSPGTRDADTAEYFWYHSHRQRFTNWTLYKDGTVMNGDLYVTFLNVGGVKIVRNDAKIIYQGECSLSLFMLICGENEFKLEII